VLVSRLNECQHLEHWPGVEADAAFRARMLSTGWHIAWLSLIPVAAATLRAVVSVIRQPDAIVRNGLQLFAIGVVFSVVAVELLPE
jgi:hypothetical protein